MQFARRKLCKTGPAGYDQAVIIDPVEILTNHHNPRPVLDVGVTPNLGRIAQRKKKYDDFYSMIMVREHKIT